MHRLSCNRRKSIPLQSPRRIRSASRDAGHLRVVGALLASDGSALLEGAPAPGNSGVPFLAINLYSTEKERSEQVDFVNLAKGVFGMFLNIPEEHT